VKGLAHSTFDRRSTTAYGAVGVYSSSRRNGLRRILPLKVQDMRETSREEDK